MLLLNRKNLRFDYQHKITTLRKRLAAAQTDADRNRVTAKLHKLAITSPG